MASQFTRRCLLSLSKGRRLTPLITRRQFTATSSAESSIPGNMKRSSAVTNQSAEAYNASDIPFAQFDGIATEQRDRFNLMKPEEYYDILVRYAGQLAQGITPRDQRPRSEVFTAEVLHDLGCILRLMPSRSRSSRDLILQTWSHAAELGSLPSLISLCHYISQGKSWGKVSWLKKYELQFKKLVAQGKDPNVLMVEAGLLSVQGNHHGAAKLLERVRKMDTEDYEWRHRGDMMLSRAYTELQRYEAAAAVLLPLAEAGIAEAQLELGKIIKQSGSDADKAREYLFQSLRTGDLQGAPLLAEMAHEDAAASKDQKTKDEHLRWAMEWTRLADPRAQN